MLPPDGYIRFGFNEESLAAINRIAEAIENIPSAKEIKELKKELDWKRREANEFSIVFKEENTGKWLMSSGTQLHPVDGIIEGNAVSTMFGPPLLIIKKDGFLGNDGIYYVTVREITREDK